MKRKLLVVSAAAAIAALWALPATAGGPLAIVNGGGTGSFFADADGDGDIEASQFGLGATILGGGEARGHFLCAMAGRSDFLGLKLMSVEGKVTGGSADVSAGTATLSGTASVNLANGTVFRGVPYTVTLTDGGAGAGMLTLTVIGAFDGVPGDTIPGNGNYDLPSETVTSGQISIRG